MTAPADADSWANALLPLPSVYDRHAGDSDTSARQQRCVRRRPDGSIDCGHNAREADRLHRAGVESAMHAVARIVAATVRRVIASMHRRPGSRLRRRLDP